jgi:hypothetical protein
VAVWYEPGTGPGPALLLLPDFSDAAPGLPEASLWTALCYGEAAAMPANAAPAGDALAASPAAECVVSYSSFPGQLTVKLCADAHAAAAAAVAAAAAAAAVAADADELGDAAPAAADDGESGGRSSPQLTPASALRVGPDLAIGPRNGSAPASGALASPAPAPSTPAAAAAAAAALPAAPRAQTTPAVAVASGRRLGVLVDAHACVALFFIDRLPVARPVDFRGTALARGARPAVMLRSEGSAADICTDGWAPPESLLSAL